MPICHEGRAGRSCALKVLEPVWSSESRQEDRTEKVFLLRQLHNEGATARNVVQEKPFYRDGCTAKV